MFSKEQISERYKEIYGKEQDFDAVEEREGFTVASKKGIVQDEFTNYSVYYILDNSGKQPEGARITIRSEKEHDWTNGYYDSYRSTETYMSIQSGKEYLASIEAPVEINTADNLQVGRFFAQVRDKEDNDFKIAKKFFAKFIGSKDDLTNAKEQIKAEEKAEQDRKKRVKKFDKLLDLAKERQKKQEELQKEEKRNLQKQKKQDKINSFVSGPVLKNKLLDKIRKIFD